jgi:hypothetical protein
VPTHGPGGGGGGGTLVEYLLPAETGEASTTRSRGGKEESRKVRKGPPQSLSPPSDVSPNYPERITSMAPVGVQLEMGCVGRWSVSEGVR